MANALETLLDLNDRLFADEEYEAAYHALMAALHLVDHAGDLQALESLQARARQQAQRVDAVVPPHRLSSTQAASRGQQPVFHSFQVHVQAVRDRLKAQQAQRRAEAAR